MNVKNLRYFRVFSIVFVAALVFSMAACVSSRHVEPCSRELLGNGIKTPVQLADFFISHNPEYGKSEILKMAEVYVKEAAMENINSDAAFVQMCLETGFLRYGNLVQPEWNNFCGLGAMDAEHPGEIFPTMEIGVRAHIQHLQAYATTADVELNNPLVDPRYSWPHKVKNAKTVFELAGSWATDKEYGFKLDSLLGELENF